MGRELAVELAQAGANIALVEWNEDTLNETAELLKAYNVGVSKHIVDVSDKEAVFTLPEKVIEEHGTVDMIFNNAGVALASTVEDSTDEDWDWGLGILLHGVINGTRAFLPYLKDRPEAAIVNTSSIFGLLSVPTQSIYHVGKYGVRAFTESLALEMKMENSPIEVYSVHPGHIGTNIANIAAEKGKMVNLKFFFILSSSIFDETYLHSRPALERISFLISDSVAIIKGFKKEILFKE